MTKHRTDDTTRLAGIREALTAANGDWQNIVALWSINADLTWLLERTERAARAEPPVPIVRTGLTADSDPEHDFDGPDPFPAEFERLRRIEVEAWAVINSVAGVQYGTSTPRQPVTAESPVHWRISGAAVDSLRAALEAHGEPQEGERDV